MAQQAIAGRNEVFQGLQITSWQVVEFLRKGWKNAGRITSSLKHGPFYADGSNTKNISVKLPSARPAIDAWLHQPRSE